MILYIILGIVVLLVLWIIAGYNKLIRLRGNGLRMQWDKLQQMLNQDGTL